MKTILLFWGIGESLQISEPLFLSIISFLDSLSYFFYFFFVNSCLYYLSYANLQFFWHQSIPVSLFYNSCCFEILNRFVNILLFGICKYLLCIFYAGCQTYKRIVNFTEGLCHIQGVIICFVTYWGKSSLQQRLPCVKKLCAGKNNRHTYYERS